MSERVVKVQQHWRAIQPVLAKVKDLAEADSTGAATNYAWSIVEAYDRYKAEMVELGDAPVSFNPYPSLDSVWRALALAKSMILSGEQMSPMAEASFQEAFQVIEALRYGPGDSERV